MYSEINPTAVVRRVGAMLTLRTELENGEIESLHVKFSRSNRKTGKSIPSVSLIPVADCGNCATCSSGCYDLRNVCYLKSVQTTRAQNSAILRKDRDRYFREIEATATLERFFRWHVGGEIVDADYFRRMVETALKVPTCTFLVFTKRFDIVNGFLDGGREIPRNLKIIFSDWKGLEMDNPYNLPVSSPVWNYGVKGKHCTEKVHWCGGHCEECATTATGCFGARKGDTILFHAH